MSLPRYEFSTEIKNDLIQFLKVSKSLQFENKNCDLNSYLIWKKLLPPDIELLKAIDDNPGVDVLPLPTVMDIDNIEKSTNKNEKTFITDGHNKITAIGDVAFVIKENLQTLQDLSETAKKDVFSVDNKDLEELFRILKDTLTIEDCYYFGNTIKLMKVENFINLYCHYLLIPMLKTEFCNKILELINEFSESFNDIIKQECVSILQELSSEEIIIALEYLKKFNNALKAKLAGSFISSITNLNDNYLKVLENLLNNDVEYEALNKLLVLLLEVADDHNRDKNFGKMLMTIIEILGPNLVHLEQPLKHIVSGHKSVWKSKLEQKFQTCYEDSMLFSQSFRN